MAQLQVSNNLIAFPRADLRNLLAQGYLPLGIAGGQSLTLLETPRSVRGGLSFIF